MSRLRLLPAAALLIGLGVVALAPHTVLAGDARTEARLLTSEGKFDAARELLAGAEEDVRNDVELRRALADAAMSYARRKDGAARKAGLAAGIDHVRAVLTLDPAALDAAATALAAGTELADLLLAEKNADGAKAQAVATCDLGTQWLTPETSDATFLQALADAHTKRGDLSHKIQDMERIIGDYGTAGALLERAAAASDKPAPLLGKAARRYMQQAQFVFDNIPIEDEHRDEEAAKKALDAAVKACASDTASEDLFTEHLLALRMLRTVGVEGEFGAPHMRDVVPAVEGLSLQVPRGKVWQTNRTEEWDLWATRQFEGEFKTLEIMVKVWSQDEALYGRLWSDVKGIAEIRAEGQLEKFDEVKSKVALHRLGEEPPEDDAKGKKKKKPKKKPKKAKGEPLPEVWHYRIVGKPKGVDRPQLMSEFFWKHPKIGVSYQVRLLDWDTPWGYNDDDVALFLRSAFGDQWPEPEEPKK